MKTEEISALSFLKGEILAELRGDIKKEDHLLVEWDVQQFWKASREDMSPKDAYNEIIMNVLDKNTQDKGNFGKPLNLYMSAEKKNDKVVALEFEDDGTAPFYDTKEFMQKVIKMGVRNKVGEKSLNGEAGVGVKDSAAFLGRNFTFSWSPGNNGKEFSLKFVRDQWTGRASESVNDYDGPSYFKLRIEDLNFDVIPPHSMRPQLSRAFSSALERHNNVNIYTCRKENVNERTEPLLPAPPTKFDPDFPQWEGVIPYHGIPITVRVGKALEETMCSQPTIVISRHGVKYVDGFDKNVCNAIFVGENGRPLTNLVMWRGVHLSIDCSEIEATTIKKSIQWDSSLTNRSIIEAVSKNANVKKTLKGIEDRHRAGDDGKISQTEVPAAVKNKINILQERGAIDLNELIKTSDVSSILIENNESSNSTVSTRKYTPRNTKGSGKNNNTKEKNIVKVNGKKKPFEIVEIDDCDDERKDLRGWLDSREDKIFLTINKSYEGYTLEIEKDQTNKLPLYIAETMGYVFYIHRQNILIDSGNITPESLKELNMTYEKDTADYIKIMTTRKVKNNNT